MVDIFLILGFLIAVFFVDKIGRYFLQITGFIGMATGLIVLALSNSSSLFDGNSLILVFTGFFLFNLSMNAGPNATTFLLSGEVFPPAIRASGAGLSGAIAKAGAILGVFLLPILQVKLGITFLLLGLGICCLGGALLTYLLRVKVTNSV